MSTHGSLSEVERFNLCIKVRLIRFATLHAFMCAISKLLKHHYGRLPATARNHEGGIG